jgi:hypothetical protein
MGIYSVRCETSLMHMWENVSVKILHDDPSRDVVPPCKRCRRKQDPFLLKREPDDVLCTVCIYICIYVSIYLCINISTYVYTDTLRIMQLRNIKSGIRGGGQLRNCVSVAAAAAPAPAPAWVPKQDVILSALPQTETCAISQLHILTDDADGQIRTPGRRAPERQNGRTAETVERQKR